MKSENMPEATKLVSSKGQPLKSHYKAFTKCKSTLSSMFNDPILVKADSWL